jgi:hypothetical protein
MGQDLGDQQPVMLGADVAGQRRPQRRQLGPQPTGLAAGHVVQVGGVEQPTLDLILEQLPDRLPLAAGRLHPDPGHPKLASHWASSTSPAVVVVTLRVSA